MAVFNIMSQIILALQNSSKYAGKDMSDTLGYRPVYHFFVLTTF